MHTAQALASIRRSRTYDTEGSTSRVRKHPNEHTALIHNNHSGNNGHVGASPGLHNADYDATDVPLTLKEDATAIYAMMMDQPLNLMMLAAPMAIWASFGGWSDLWIFIFNFVVMIPLANLLEEPTESLAFHTGEAIGGLVNATFGNAVEDSENFGWPTLSREIICHHTLGEPEEKVDEFAKFSLERFDGINGAVDGWRIYVAVT
ncbi:hypothetical protein PsorP6_010078 [Peronosclerospora sorghi]|uniref:Uncharacterized protein n=1 Tax=Peronosclerospora sorghi TaxID=230839 RepID=A0ACC0VTL5_9STRA|nr:hypothetical protein PsorP6_010078 [Peronosclerospora sorghi]